MSIHIFFSFSTNHAKYLESLLQRQNRLADRVKHLQSTTIEQVTPESLPPIYAITPTYKRYTQKADLTRLSQTFMHIPNFHWILVEDSTTKTKLVTNLLKKKNLNYTHLNVKTQSKLAKKENDPHWKKHRGVDQRNLGLKWIRENVKDKKGVVYLADDDNTYDLDLFKEVKIVFETIVIIVQLSLSSVRFFAEGQNVLAASLYPAM